MVEEMEVTEAVNGEDLPISTIPNLELAKLRVLQDPRYEATLAEHLKSIGAATKEETLKKLEAKIQDAVESQGESEVRQAWLEKAEFLCNIGDIPNSLEAFQTTLDKTVGVGNQLDVVFQMFRIGLYQMDHPMMKAKIDKAKELMEKGGDWERKNRLKAYEGLYALSIRDFETAARLFLDCVSTFTSYELMSYKELVFYTVISAILTLERKDLKAKVLKCDEINQQLFNDPEVYNYANSFYNCEYKCFFDLLAVMEGRLKADWILAPHYKFYVRAMRVSAYRQFLTPYRSVTLGYMAKEFGVTPEYIDAELHKFIAGGQLQAKIDKVTGLVETSQIDSKNLQYQSVIKQGDFLLNRVQKLARVINT